VREREVTGVDVGSAWCNDDEEGVAGGREGGGGRKQKGKGLGIMNQ